MDRNPSHFTKRLRPNHQEWPRQTKPKKGQSMNFSQGHSGTKVQCESCLFSQGKTPEFTKMGEIHELFVLALSLVWFAGATPEIISRGFYNKAFLTPPKLKVILPKVVWCRSLPPRESWGCLLGLPLVFSSNGQGTEQVNRGQKNRTRKKRIPGNGGSQELFGPMFP